MSSAVQLGFDALDQAASPPTRQQLIARLVPIAQDLAQQAGPRGVTVGELRAVASRRGILPPAGKKRELAFLGRVMTAAGLHASGQYRRSELKVTHGNLHAVWVRP